MFSHSLEEFNRLPGRIVVRTPYSILFLLSALLCACGPEEEQPEPPHPKVTVQNPEIKEILEWDEYTGRLEAVDFVEVRARVSGYLNSVHFREGEDVEKGAVLFVIDPRPFAAEVAARAAELDEAEAKVELAELNRNRAKGLVASKAIAQEEFDTRVNAYTQAVAAKETARAELEAAELQLEFTKVTAPISGIIGQKLVTEGNLITGGTEGSTLLTTIVPHDPIYAYFNVDERAVLKYVRLAMENKLPARGEEGSIVEMGLSDSEGYPFKGKLDFVNNRLDEATATLRARAIFENKDRFLTPGLFARVRVPAGPKHEAVLIQDEAVVSDQRTRLVWVVKEDDTVEPRVVELGPLHEGLRIVRTGLSAADRVVVSGVQRLRPGAKVSPVAAESAQTGDFAGGGTSTSKSK
jgi:RND family efflux transporter MFP subunit